MVEFTAMSERALLYFKEGFEHKILSMGEAHGAEETKFQDYLLRELMSENKLRYLVPIKTGNKIETRTIEKNGPVAFIVTTTQNSLNPENETRMLSLECDDSEAQTRRVIAKVATIEGYGQEPVENDYRPWHDYQRWLAAGECRVVVPFARTLGKSLKSVKSVRLRRDFGQLLRAIKAHALLHRQHRKRNAEGYIIATIRDDYAAVRRLMAELLATAAELRVRHQIEATVAAVRELEEEKNADPRSAAVREAAGANGITVRELADRLRLDMQAARRRLRKAEDDGFLINLEDRKNRPARYRAPGEALAASGELLPTPGELKRALDEAHNRLTDQRADEIRPRKDRSA